MKLVPLFDRVVLEKEKMEETTASGIVLPGQNDKEKPGQAVVVAVGPGTTEVYAEYEGVKISCVIRCNFQESSGVSGNGGGVSEDGGGASAGGNNTSGDTASGSCAVYSQYGPASDITIKVNDTITLTLKDAAGNPIDVSWSISGSGCSLSGNIVTGVAAGTISTISATYNGETYSCIIRIN